MRVRFSAPLALSQDEIDRFSQITGIILPKIFGSNCAVFIVQGQNQIVFQLVTIKMRLLIFGIKRILKTLPGQIFPCPGWIYGPE